MHTTIGANTYDFGYTVKTADYATKNSQNSTAQDVTYNLAVNLDQVSQGEAGNFTFADGVLTDGLFSHTFAKEGVITPKDITATVVNNNLIKTYDATTAVAGNGDALVTLTGLVAGDGTGNATTAAYDAKNAGARTVTYTLAATGGEDASNYRFVDGAGTAITAVTGAGTINPYGLTLSFDSVNRDYDGTTAIADNLVKPQLAAAFAGDTVSLASGYTANYIDPNVKTVNANSTAAVNYDGLKLTGADAANYALVDTQGNALVASSQTTGTQITTGVGTMNARALSAADLTIDRTSLPITKVYDGKTDVATDTVKAEAYVDQLHTTIGTNTYDFGYTVKAADYATKNSQNSTAQDVTYKLAVNLDQVSQGEAGNFTFADGVLTDGLFSHTFAKEGAITPKDITAAVVNNNLIKTYDATTAVAGTGDALVTLTGLVAGDGTGNATTAAYDAKNAGARTVTYTLAATGGEDASNYRFVDGAGTAITAVTGAGTINPYGLTLSFDSVNRDYDGTTAIADNLVKPQLAAAFAGDTVSLASGYTANYIDPNVKTVNASSETSVIYDGLKLTGIDAANYTLINSSGTLLDASKNMAGTQTMNGAGTMNKFVLTGDNVTFSFNPITKEYDATTVVKYKGETTDEALRNYLADHYVTLGNGAAQDIVTDMDSVTYDNANHGTGKTVTFMMSLNGDNYDYSNLQANGVVDEAGRFKAQTTNGDISVRKIYASLTDNPADSSIVKTYDGTTTVLQDTSGKVTLRDGDLLTSLDGVTLDTANSNARYADANAGTKSVYYDVRLKGDTAGNYEIHDLAQKDTANDGEISLLTGTGTINKALLTVSFDRQEKDYDGTADVKTIAPVLSGLVNGESLVFNDTAKSKISGQYGSQDATTQQFTASKDVSRDASENVLDKGVYYTGAAEALQSMVDQGNTIASNYTVADTAYFNEAAAKGRIRPLSITQSATADWKPVTKEYDRTTAVPTASQAGALSLSVVGTVENTPIILDYTVGTASYDNKNVGTDHTLTYTIAAVNQNLGNYQLSDEAATAIKNTNWTSAADNSITPRHINASLTNTADVTKVYDGTIASDTGNLVVDADDAKMLAADGVNTVITAAYGDKNATIDPGAAHTNSKTVTYTLGLDDSSNYVIDENTYTATGDIERRTVYADFTNGSSSGMDKIYDGTNAVADRYRDRIGLVAADGSTGVVDSGIELLANSISAAYQSPNVKRDSTGTVTTQDVYFSNFNLKDTDITDGDDAGNYITGGAVNPMQGSFVNDTIQYRMRQFSGGALYVPDAVIWSDGSES